MNNYGVKDLLLNSRISLVFWVFVDNLLKSVSFKTQQLYHLWVCRFFDLKNTMLTMKMKFKILDLICGAYFGLCFFKKSS
jgi:hypothetical protein